MKAGARVTATTLRTLEVEVGARLQAVEVTTLNDRERMFLILTPRCRYCGNLNPRPRCVSCGAPSRVQ